ncbi:MAG: hypothetical protein CSA97_00820 [Bacteroidetes bacterium]|nr:MAG: hypothetical protein CSA97_00820 [Bacteroidota bacterium]
MRKFLKVLLIVVCVLVVLVVGAAIAIPVFFKPRVLSFAQAEINKRVNAEVSFADVDLSVFRGFPDLYVSLDGLSVVNKGVFEGDTLVSFDRFAVEVGLFSLFNDSAIELHSVTLVRPRVTAIKSATGEVNWDIAAADSVAQDSIAEELSDTVSAASGLRVALEKLEISSGYVGYFDDSSKMVARLDDVNFSLGGDLGLDRSKLDLELLIGRLLFEMGGVTYAPDLRLSFDAKVDADLANAHYVLEDNRLTVDDLGLSFEGWVDMPGDSVRMDMRFATTDSDLKGLLSLVPSSLLKGYEDVETAGVLSLSGRVAGLLHGKQLPSADLHLLVKNGMVHYPSLPERIENIGIDLGVAFDGVQQDRTVVDLKRLAVSVAGNPLEATAKVRTPMSDPQVRATAKGRVDLESLRKAVPLDSLRLTGMLTVDASMFARMSWVEKEQYEKCELSGNLRLQDASVEGVMDAPILVKDLSLVFNPNRVGLETLQASVGRSDVVMEGSLSNFLPYVMTDGVLRGNLSLRSRLLDLNELFPKVADGEATKSAAQEPADPVAGADTVAVDVSIMKRIDFDFKSKLSQIYFQNMDIKDAVGRIHLANSVLDLREVSCKMLDGSALVSGSFDFSDPVQRSAKLEMDFRGIDVQQGVTTFTSVQAMVPQVKRMKGRVDLKVSADTELTPALSPVLNTVNASGRVHTTRLSIRKDPFFTKLGALLKNEYVTNPTLVASTVRFWIVNGNMRFEPFSFDIKGIKSQLGGRISLDRTMDLAMNITVPRAMLGKAASKVQGLLNSLSPDLDIGEMIPVDISALGSISDPKISVEIAQEFQDRLEAFARAKAKEVLDKAKAKAREEAARIIAKAEQEAQRIRDKADRAASEALAKAQKEADRLEGKAKGYFQKTAAREASKRVMRQARKTVRRIQSEADDRANAILSRARQEAARLD